jgi:SMI1 / KNR4 family (SUKH-1)
MAEIDDALLQKIRNDGDTKAASGAASANIEAAQQTLGVRFPPSYVQFLRAINGGELRDLIIFGVHDEKAKWPNEEARPKTGDIVKDSLQARVLPHFEDGTMLPFGASWGGDYVCFDLTRRAEDGEYPILFYAYEDSECIGLQPFSNEAADFGEFLENLYANERLNRE